MRHPLRLIAAVTAFAVAAVVVLALSSSGPDPIDNPHGQVDADRVARVLRATSAASSASRAETVAAGRRLFTSSDIAKRGESCASCHTAGTENESVGTIMHSGAGTDFVGPRDPPTLLGAARTEPFGWTGATPTLRAMAVNTILGHFKEGTSQPASVTARQADQLVAYIETFRAPTTDFDRGTLSAAARRGEVLFQGKAGCIACHGGPDFTDNGLHNTLVPQVSGGNDPGAKDPPGAFNTPQMRDLKNSAPYMHNGSLKTLRDVVTFYNARSSVSPLNLSEQEITDLVEYLASL